MNSFLNRIDVSGKIAVGALLIVALPIAACHKNGEPSQPDSMGGFGAVNLGLHHPELYTFAGGISAALDVPSRPFSIKRWEQWRRFRAIFGPWEGQSQKNNDPFLLVRSADTKNASYFFLTCGEKEGLLGPNRRFASLLEAHHFQYEFHTTRGDHNWKQWDEWLPELFRSLEGHLATAKPA